MKYYPILLTFDDPSKEIGILDKHPCKFFSERPLHFLFESPWLSIVLKESKIFIYTPSMTPEIWREIIDPEFQKIMEEKREVMEKQNDILSN